MLHDSGVAEFFQVVRDETAPPPESVSLKKKAVWTFGELAVGTTRFHQAAQVERQIDRRIEIWRDDTIDTRDLCRIDGLYYLIEQVDRGTDEDGLLVTRISLERTDGSIWEAANREHQE